MVVNNKNNNKNLKLYGLDTQINELTNIINIKFLQDSEKHHTYYKKDLLPNAILISGRSGIGKSMLFDYLKEVFKDKINIVDISKKLEAENTENQEKAYSHYFSAIKFPKLLNNTNTIYLLDDFNTIEDYFLSDDSALPQTKKIISYLQNLIKPEFNNFLITSIQNSSVINSNIRKLFDTEIKLPSLNFDSRLAIMKSYLGNTSINLNDLIKVAEITENYTGSELIKLIKVTYQKTIKEKKSVLTYADFSNSIKKIRPIQIKNTEPSWEFLGGMKTKIDEIRNSIILPLKYSELFKKYNVKPPKGILLYGPTGTGKTSIAKNLAKESKFNFFSFSPSNIHTMWHGEDERKLKEQFKKAKDNQPAILFIDEIESIASKRYEGPNSKLYNGLVDEFLYQMDGIEELKGVAVIAATNRLDLLDPAIIRSGRFDKKINISLPNLDGRKEILNIYMDKFKLNEQLKMDKNIFIEQIAEKTSGLSGADIENLCNQVGENIIHKKITMLENKKNEFTNESLIQIFKRIMIKQNIEDKPKQIGFINEEDMKSYYKEFIEKNIKNKLRTNKSKIFKLRTKQQ